MNWKMAARARKQKKIEKNQTIWFMLIGLYCHSDSIAAVRDFYFQSPLKLHTLTMLCKSWIILVLDEE